MKQVGYMVMAAVLAFGLAGCKKQEPMKSLTSDEIRKLVTGNTIEGTSTRHSKEFTQYFGKDGNTVQLINTKRTGKWRIDDTDHLCIKWNPLPDAEKKATNDDNDDARRQKERCFAVKQDSQGTYHIISGGGKTILMVQKSSAGNPGKL